MISCYKVIPTSFSTILFLYSEFKIYFSAIHRLLEVENEDFEFGHIMGDLTYIEPTSSFGGFSASKTVEIPLVFEYWSVQETDNMPVSFLFDAFCQ